MGLKKYFGTLLSDGRVEIKIPDSWRVVLSKIVGRIPTVNQLDHDTIAKNVRTGTLYVLKESEAGEKEVVEIGAGGGGPDPDSHTRLHSMVDPLDHAAAAEADRGKALGNNASTGAPEWFTRPENFWKRTLTVLSPATSDDNLVVSVNGAKVAVQASTQTGDALSGTVNGGNAVRGAATTGRGGYFTSISGYGVTATSQSGVAGYFTSTSGSGIFASSDSGMAITARTFAASTNDVWNSLSIQRQTSGTAANGIGAGINFSIQTIGGAVVTSANQTIKLTDAASASLTSEYNLLLRHNGAGVSEALKVKATGETKALGLYPFPQAIFRQTSGKTISNTTTETTLYGSGVGTRTIPANRLEAGSTIRIKIQGYLNTPASDENATFKVKFGSTELISISGNLPQSLSDAAVVVDLLMTCRSAGATGTMMAAGVVLIEIRGAGYNAMIRLQTTSEITIDTTSANDVNLTFKWDAAKVANQMITNVSLVELI